MLLCMYTHTSFCDGLRGDAMAYDAVGTFRPSLDACVAAGCLWSDPAGCTLTKRRIHSHETRALSSSKMAQTGRQLIWGVGKGSCRIKYVQYDRVKIGVPLPSQNFGAYRCNRPHSRTHGHFTSDFEQNSPSGGFAMSDLLHHIYNI